LSSGLAGQESAYEPSVSQSSLQSASLGLALPLHKLRLTRYRQQATSPNWRVTIFKRLLALSSRRKEVSLSRASSAGARARRELRRTISAATGPYTPAGCPQEEKEGRKALRVFVVDDSVVLFCYCGLCRGPVSLSPLHSAPDQRKIDVPAAGSSRQVR
jgi:hypothetical protein